MSRGSITKIDIISHILKLKYRIHNDSDLDHNPEAKHFANKYLNDLLFKIDEYTY